MSCFQQYLRPAVGGIIIACMVVVFMVFAGNGTIYKVTHYEPIYNSDSTSRKSQYSDSGLLTNYLQNRGDAGNDAEESAFEFKNDRDESNQKRHKPLTPQSRLVYNRVGKCGSRTVIGILDELSTRNSFTFYASEINNQTHISLKDQMELVNIISSLEPPFVYQRHFHYIDFPKFGAIQPVYFNIIRDPIDRFVSGYYYKRFGDFNLRHKYLQKTFPDRNMTIDECVLSNKRECMENALFYIVPFFCGQDKLCSAPSQWALERAISNLDQRFLVVGFIEKLKDTMQVLELLLPDMFEGAVEILNHPATNAKTEQTASTNKIPPSDRVRSIMRGRMKYEYEFYEVALKRFAYIKTKLGIKSS